MERALGMIGLRVQIGLVGLLGTLIMITVAVLTLTSMRHQERQQQIMDRAVNANDLVSSIDVGMLQARRHEKDFLLRSDEKAVDQQRQAIETVNHALEALAAVFLEPDSLVLAGALKARVAQYAGQFGEVAAHRATLGLSEDEGLLGRMRTAAHAIETGLTGAREPRLEILMLTLRRQEKDFFVRRDLKEAEDFRGTSGRLAAALAESAPGETALDDASRADLGVRLAEYRDTFLRAVEESRAVAEATRKLSESYADLQLILDRLIARTGRAYAAIKAESAGARADMVNFVVAVLGVGVVVLMISAAVISGAVCRPLIGLTALMKRLATGDLAVRVPHQGDRNEIGEMARAVQVFKDNAIDKARMDEAERQRLEAECRAAEAQRAFIATMSHEFRTPLTVINGHAQQLAAHAELVEPPEIREHAGKVRGAVRRIQRLIDGILLSEKVALSQIHFTPAPVDLRGLIENCGSRHRDIARDREIIMKFDDLPPVIECDETLLDHLLDNILSNAVKYSSPPGPIEIEGGREENFAVIRVRDAGEGIAAEDLPFIFGRYYRGRNAYRVAGFGIGLHLAHSIVLLHGGSISVASAPDAGSTFTIRLPVTHPGLQV
jgi:signal transduction histidine kinase